MKKRKQKKSGGDTADLEKMILAKKEGAFNSFLNNLEAKYCTEEEPKSRKRKPGKADVEAPKKRVKKN